MRLLKLIFYLFDRLDTELEMFAGWISRKRYTNNGGHAVNHYKVGKSDLRRMAYRKGTATSFASKMQGESLVNQILWDPIMIQRIDSWMSKEADPENKLVLRTCFQRATGYGFRKEGGNLKAIKCNNVTVCLKRGKGKLPVLFTAYPSEQEGLSPIEEM